MNQPDFICASNLIGPEPSAEGAIGILQSKRLWMRNTTCMADYREVQHGFEILQRWFNEKNTKNFIDTFDQIIPGAAGTALQNFNKWWADLNAYKVFVTSMSEHLMSDDQHGRLSMWRGFGNNAKVRVALVLRLPVGSLATEATSLIFSPVSYLREPEVGDAMQEVIKRAREKSDFLKQQPPGVIQALLFSTLYAGVTCLKHEGFKEEQEWRAVYNPQAWSSPLIESEMKVIDGVPQEIKKIPLGSDTDPRLYDLDVRSVLDRVIIGPSHFPYAIAQAFIGELKKLGVDNSEGMVFASGTPIR